MKLFFYAERVCGCAVLLLGCLAPLLPHQKQLDGFNELNDGPWIGGSKAIGHDYIIGGYGQRIYPVTTDSDICQTIHQCLSDAVTSNVRGVSCLLPFGGKHTCAPKRVEYPYILQNCRRVWTGTQASMECWQVPLTQR